MRIATILTNKRLGIASQLPEAPAGSCDHREEPDHEIDRHDQPDPVEVLRGIGEGVACDRIAEATPRREIQVDKEQIARVLNNLLDNAIKYSPQGGSIWITARVKKNFIHVSVKDEGIGLTRWQVKKIFKRFFRVDTSNTAIEGLGLGLTIVKQTIELYGGKVRVKSKLNKGSTITFTLPLTK